MYERDFDYFQPDQGEYCPTSPNFPRFQSIGNGEYILVSIGDSPKSHQYSEFQLYDVKEKIVASVFRRQAHSNELSGTILNYFGHPIRKHVIFMITFEDNIYFIYEIDVLHNECHEVCTI